MATDPTQTTDGAAHDPGGRSKPPWRDGSRVVARFSDCGLYRYELAEIWGGGVPVMFLMMNPSVAGIKHADPTLIRTGDFARAWGFAGQLVGNVHAYRVTDSKLLIKAADPVGPENDAALLRMAKRSQFVVLAYGLPPKPLRPRAETVVAMLRQAGVRLTYLALTQDRTPRHPLYLRGDLTPLDWPPS